MAVRKAPLSALVWAQAKNLETSGQRPGQALFNALAVYCPAVAEKLRGTPDDPFFREAESDAYQALESKIMEMLPS